MTSVTHEELSAILSNYATKQDLESFVTDEQVSNIFEAVQLIVKAALEAGFTDKINEMSKAFNSLQSFIYDELRDLNIAITANQTETEERLEYMGKVIDKLSRKYNPRDQRNGHDTIYLN